MLSLGTSLSLKGTEDAEKLRPFECGFLPQAGGLRRRLSLPFFLLTLIFLIFDVELVLLFPYLSRGALSTNWGEALIYLALVIALSLTLA